MYPRGGDIFILNVRTVHGSKYHCYNLYDGMSERCQHLLGCPLGGGGELGIHAAWCITLHYRLVPICTEVQCRVSLSLTSCPALRTSSTSTTNKEVNTVYEFNANHTTYTCKRHLPDMLLWLSERQRYRINNNHTQTIPLHPGLDILLGMSISAPSNNY